MTHNFSKESKIIVKLKAILEANLGKENFGVKELAREVGLSRSSLHRKVHAYNGNSTSQFIREFRLQKAMELLQENELTVSEIAYSVGFSTPTYFNTCFKDFYGYPPGEAKYKGKEQISKGSAVDRNTTTWSDKIPSFFTRSRVIILAVSIGIIIALFTSFYIRSNRTTDNTDLATVAEGKSIAVLPLKNWSGDPDLEYRSDGMTDAIITRLSFIQNLKVTPYTSVLKYKSSAKDAPSIANELGVQYILQGNYQLYGEQVKITLHLIHGPSNTNISSKEYRGAWKDDIFSMQAAVVEDLMRQLNMEINRKEHLSIERIPTNNREAYNNWLMARHQALKYTKTGMVNAISLYEQAIHLDSAFVEPYVDLAQLYLLGGASWGFYSEGEAWDMSKKLLTKAIEIDDTFPNAKAVLNDGLYIYEWDFETMEKNYRKESNLSITYCLQSGRFEEALILSEQLHLDNPASVYLITTKAMALYFLNRREEALSLLKSSDNLYADHIMYLRIAARVYFYMNKYEHSYFLLNKFIQNYSERPPTVLWMLAACENRKGNIDMAKKYLAEIEHRYYIKASGSPAWFLALYYSSLGEKENAFIWLKKSYERHEVEMIWLREEPPLKPLRSDSRYLELYQKVGFTIPPHPE